MNGTILRSTLTCLFALISVVVLSTEAFAQNKQRVIIMRNLATGRDTVLADFPSQPYDTLKAKRNWSNLRKGFSVDRVIRLLGRPSKLEPDPENAKEYWWYGRRAVVFNSMTNRVYYWDK